jgi:uncharacterized protein (DUF1800 family)
MEVPISLPPASPSGEAGNSLTRRQALRQGLLAGVGIGATLLGGAGCRTLQERARTVTGPTPARFEPLPHDVDAVATATRVLNRVAFGPRPGDVAQVAAMGAAGWIEEQLADRMDEDPAANWRVNGLDVQQTERDAPDELFSMADEQLLRETEQAALLRAVYSRHQLRETLADFWTNHFNIFALKNDGRTLIPTDTEQVLRPHVLGTFHAMLVASAHSPAMLSYLDNQQNRVGVANENYARELLELHTLGVKSGYTQKDIQAVARCFTGWTVRTGVQHGQFVYDDTRHDRGRKVIPFLDLTLEAGGGQKDADTVLERLALHPATARFVARKLCRRFLGQASDATVAKAATAYLKSGSDIRATLRPILLDALPSAPETRPLLKRPLDMIVSSLRVLAADTDGGVPLQRHLAEMGQPLYQWPMPDGFPEKTSAWTGSLLSRWNFALALTANTIGGTTVDLNAPLAAAKAHTDADILDTLIEAILARPADSAEVRPIRTQVGDHVERARRNSLPDATVLAEAAGLLLAAPLFQWK